MQKIITIDGGGLRGIIPVILLQRLSKDYPSLLDDVGMIAGTSTGGIVALALASGVSLQDLFDLYADKGTEIFSDCERPFFTRPIMAKYNNSNLQKELHNLFGDKTMADLRTPVIIPAFSIHGHSCHGNLFRARVDDNRSAWAPRVFDSRAEGDAHVPLKNIALYTCSAPTYFPAVNGYVDGGVYANNPSMLALSVAIYHGASMEDIALLSLGTGSNRKSIANPNYDAGYNWIFNLVDLLLDGVNDIAHTEAQEILREKYLRLQMVLPKNIAMDDVSGVGESIDVANAYEFTPQIHSWVQKNFLSCRGLSV